jgi:hypothetical protein
MQKTEASGNKANTVMAGFAKNYTNNNPFEQLNHVSFNRYNRTLIKRDSLDFSTYNENLFSERISQFEYIYNLEKELIIAQKNQGFEKPVVKILSHRMHSTNWYDKYYVIFETEYASPLNPNNFRAYNYQLIVEDDNFYYIKFSPRLSNKDKLFVTRLHA